MGAIVNFFAASDEAQVRFGSDTVVDRITEIYSQLFNRAPDAEGMAFWTNAIDKGHASLADVAMSILGGAQGNMDTQFLANGTGISYVVQWTDGEDINSIVFGTFGSSPFGLDIDTTAGTMTLVDPSVQPDEIVVIGSITG